MTRVARGGAYTQGEEEEKTPHFRELLPPGTDGGRPPISIRHWGIFGQTREDAW